MQQHQIEQEFINWYLESSVATDSAHSPVLSIIGFEQLRGR